MFKIPANNEWHKHLPQRKSLKLSDKDDELGSDH
jgi:hypothetical protein